MQSDLDGLDILPAEVWDRVLGFAIHSDYGAGQTVRSIRLTCSVFNERTRHLHWQTISLPTLDIIERFHNLLASTPNVQRDIQFLYIHTEDPLFFHPSQLDAEDAAEYSPSDSSSCSDMDVEEEWLQNDASMEADLAEDLVFFASADSKHPESIKPDGFEFLCVRHVQGILRVCSWSLLELHWHDAHANLFPDDDYSNLFAALQFQNITVYPNLQKLVNLCFTLNFPVAVDSVDPSGFCRTLSWVTDKRDRYPQAGVHMPALTSLHVGLQSMPDWSQQVTEKFLEKHAKSGALHNFPCLQELALTFTDPEHTLWFDIGNDWDDTAQHHCDSNAGRPWNIDLNVLTDPHGLFELWMRSMDGEERPKICMPATWYPYHAICIVRSTA